MKSGICISAAILAASAGQALAQVAVDGQVGSGEPYQQVWVQDQPTSYGDNLPGSIGVAGDPENVVKGLELKIPLSALGTSIAAIGPGSPIKIGGFMGSISNQIFATDGLPFNSPSLGLGKNVNFAAAPYTGNQFISIVPSVENNAPVLDGVLDGGNPNGAGGWWAGKRVWLQSNFSSLGNNTFTNGKNANGSEIDNMYAAVSNNGTPEDTSDDALYLFIGGNFHNYNRLAMFFDAIAGGQNRILNANPNLGFTNLMQDIKATSASSTDGLRWDAGFEPELMIVSNSGGGSTNNATTPPTVNADTMYFDQVTLPSDVGGVASFLGSVQAQAVPATLTGGLLVAYDQSNTVGVGGAPVGGSVIPSPDLADGSEINSIYGYVDDNGTAGDTSDDKLKLLVAGNLESNFNKLIMFYDVDGAEGQNQLRGDNDSPKNPDIGVSNGLNRMGALGNGTTGAGAGLKFDTGFTADYMMVYNTGGSPVQQYLDAAVLRLNGRNEISGFATEFSGDSGGDKSSNNPIVFGGTFAETQGFGADPAPCPSTGSLSKLRTNAGPRRTGIDNPAPLSCIDPNTLIANSIKATINNNNVGGVQGGAAGSVAGAASVTTGVEIEVSLAELGWNGVDPIKVAGFLCGSNFDSMSNQVLGGSGSTADLGEITLVDFSAIAGNQFVVIPTGPTGPTCNDLDFNNDGNIEPLDVDAYFSILGEGPCLGGSSCDSLDFNNDGNIEPEDVDAYFSVLGEGPCINN